MAESDNSPDNYKPLKISIGAIIKNLKMLKFFYDHGKTKKMCKKSVQK